MSEYYKLDNKTIINELIIRLENCEKEAKICRESCNWRHRRDLTSTDIENYTQRCINYQKEWVRIKKALDYALTNIRGITYNKSTEYDEFINKFISTYGKGAEKQFKKYSINILVFEKLAKPFMKQAPEDEIERKLESMSLYE